MKMSHVRREKTLMERQSNPHRHEVHGQEVHRHTTERLMGRSADYVQQQYGRGIQERRRKNPRT